MQHLFAARTTDICLFTGTLSTTQSVYGRMRLQSTDRHGRGSGRNLTVLIRHMPGVADETREKITGGSCLWEI